MTSYEHYKKWKAKFTQEEWRAYCRANYRKYRDKVLASNRRSLARVDPEVRKQRNREAQVRYWTKNGERLRAHRRKRFASNPKIRAQIQEWKKANPDRVKILRNKGNGIRRARERAVVIGDLTDIQKIYERCAELRRWFTGLVVDHVIPLAKGGTHEASNLQIIYDFENEKKATRLDYKPKVVFV